mmetsp:Transcript_90610/g.251978  ORF Transcript_90610/g.251978 Transcript_90610/m.251978 type:complete len:300 (-) Transcript_90610:719-1618(-)
MASAWRCKPSTSSRCRCLVSKVASLNSRSCCCAAPRTERSRCTASSPASEARVVSSKAARSSPTSTAAAACSRSACRPVAASLRAASTSPPRRSSAAASPSFVASSSAQRPSNARRLAPSCDTCSSALVTRPLSSPASQAAAARWLCISVRGTISRSMPARRASRPRQRSSNPACSALCAERRSRSAPRRSSWAAAAATPSAASRRSSPSMRPNSRCRSCSWPVASVAFTSEVMSSATMLRIVSSFFSRSKRSRSDSTTPTISRTVAFAKSWMTTSTLPKCLGCAVATRCARANSKFLW